MKWLQFLFLLFFAVDAFAVPARSYVFRAKMADGTYQNIRFCGDENRRLYLDENGCVVEQNAEGLFVGTGKKPADILPGVRSMRATGIGVLEDAPIKSFGSPVPTGLFGWFSAKLELLLQVWRAYHP